MGVGVSVEYLGSEEAAEGFAALVYISTYRRSNGGLKVQRDLQEKEITREGSRRT